MSVGIFYGKRFPKLHSLRNIYYVKAFILVIANFLLHSVYELQYVFIKNCYFMFVFEIMS